MSRFGLVLLRFLLVMVWPAMAAAHVAITAKTVHLRAGPDRAYPVVAVLPAATEVSVLGCLRGYTWCDVTAGAERGWVWAGNINYRYQGSSVPVLRHGAEIGIVVVPFILFDYWRDHYRAQPWYRDRDRWAHAPRRPLPGIRPPPVMNHLPPPPRRPYPPPPGLQPPSPTHRPPPEQTDRRHLPPPPHGVSREAPPPPARGTQSDQRH